ncbi:lysine N(6)-hydroxylase/L-ornithine N(5)-oxygenase family protein [Eleftheria terrae]|uniref:lysine N(6)-hydroxylase/L-ornithine N(5)-oxygenase family protein n=1 Tax=Eleftheria terrae TaxID=1597781 RepID=UPI00263BA960|nr:SidA/IucD/PvdA family monooxygenase [Eleftheria terrae]WKB50628.1 SidA/IucD/PvdA family monooxygenase [Eleftheria terrae]
MESTASAPIHDLIGVGAGPFNLGLAALLDPLPSLSCRFFEAKDRFNWHAGLLMEDCTLQVPFMADLVTMVDPTSRYSYLNYLHEQGRLYQFYFYENFHIPRTEYNRYCQWVSQQLRGMQFSTQVIGVEPAGPLFRVSVRDTASQAVSHHLARNLVLGIGTVPSWPEAARDFQGHPGCLHSADYLFRKAELQRKKSITIVGGGQSAAEIVLDLLNEQPAHGYELHWISRSSGFFPMEYSKLGLEHFSPDYIEHFHRLPEEQRNRVRSGQGHWYKGISFSTIKDIYDRLYIRSIEKAAPVVLQARTELTQLEAQAGRLRLTFRHLDLQQCFEVESDAVVLATGHQYVFPSFLNGVRHALQTNAQGQPLIDRNYGIVSDATLGGRIYVQNGEMHTHGIGAQDLGLGPYRSATIINTVLGREHYRVSSRNVFQSFGIADKWRTAIQDAA